MIRRVLGRTNLEVTQLGYGSMGLRGPKTWGVRVVDDEAADVFLNAVLDAGINFIDTAPDYGASEERIGRFISSRRKEFVLATKCGCVYRQCEDHLELDHVWKADVIRKNLETSLERLKTDVIDILQFHGSDAETLQREGLIELLLFLGYLSINLAVINFLPIPVLDGGHMVFLLWEGISRRKPDARVIGWAHGIGIVFIISLFAFVMYLDIFVNKLGTGG